LLGPGIVLIVLYAKTFFDSSDKTGYWPGVTASSAIFLLIPCSLCAAAGALEGSRTRRGKLQNIPSPRHSTTIVFQNLWPVVAGGIVLQFAAVALVARGTWGALGAPDIRVLFAFSAIIFLHSSIGYILGRTTPIAVGVSLSMLISYVWLGFTWASSYFPLRYLSGLAISSCCRADYALDPRALIAVSLFSLVVGAALIAVASITLVGTRGRVVAVVAFALLATLAATCGSLSTASRLGAAPLVARSTTDLNCSGEQPRICLFPELLEFRDPRPDLRTAWTSITQTGLVLPNTIISSPNASTPDSLRMALRPTSTTEDILGSFATAVLQPELYISGCGIEQDALRSSNSSVILSWLSLHEGSDTPPDLSRYGDGQAGEARLAQLPMVRQSEWIQQNLPALTDCSLRATPVPSQ
jgi:hypothetical protein